MASLTVTKFSLGIKNFVDEKTLAIGLDKALVGSGDTGYYVVLCQLGGKQGGGIRGKKSHDAQECYFDGRAELELVCENPLRGLTATELRITSQDFSASFRARFRPGVSHGIPVQS